MTFPLFPDVPVDELKKITPEFGLVSEPLSQQYFTVLFVALFIMRIVDVPETADVLVLVIVIFVRSLVVPVAFTLPSIVTLSAPFRLINGAARLPDILTPGIVGYINIDEYSAFPVPLAFKTAELISNTSPLILISKEPVLCVPALKASKAPFKLV